MVWLSNFELGWIAFSSKRVFFPDFTGESFHDGTHAHTHNNKKNESIGRNVCADQVRILAHINLLTSLRFGYVTKYVRRSLCVLNTACLCGNKSQMECLSWQSTNRTMQRQTLNEWKSIFIVFLLHILPLCIKVYYTHTLWSVTSFIFN